MEHLWAPWRAVYVGKNGKENGATCIFCDKLHSAQDEANYLLYRGKKAFVLLNLYPYNNGHLLIAPKRHVGELTGLTREEMSELAETSQAMVNLLKKAFHPDGFNIGANLGAVAGAGVPGHFHLHIVPRWTGDTNFMPVLGETRVISEGLEVTYRKLKEVIMERAK